MPVFERDLRPKLHPCFYDIFLLILWRKFCGILVRLHEIVKLQSLEFRVSNVIPANVQNISHFFGFFLFFLLVLLKKPPIKLHGAFDHFSRTYEIAKF